MAGLIILVASNEDIFCQHFSPYCKDKDLDLTYLIVYFARTRPYCDMMAFGDGKHDSNGHFVYISHLYYKDKNLEPTYLIATEICLSSFDRSSGAADVPLSPCNGHPYQKCVSAPFVSSKSCTKHLGNADAAVWPLYSLPSLRHQIDPLALWCIIFNRKGQKPNSLPCMNDVL
ncbi:hypothetical protein Goshw_004275, partial [Gossypium schwendimanii]|nr:hypothetical protein [Gossypium schwendimanii]